MVGTFKPLNRQFKIVNPDGTPTEFFIRWAQSNGLDLEEAVSLEDLQVVQDEVNALETTVNNLSLDDLTDVDLGTPSNNDVLTYDSGTGLWEAQAGGGGGGGGWTLIDVHDFSVDNAAFASVTGVDSYTELMIIADAVSRASGSSGRTSFFSIDSGSTWESAYFSYNFNGSVTARNSPGATGNGGNGAQYISHRVLNNVDGSLKRVTGTGTWTETYLNQTSVINAMGSGSANQTDICTGGKIYFLGR